MILDVTLEHLTAEQQKNYWALGAAAAKANKDLRLVRIAIAQGELTEADQQPTIDKLTNLWNVTEKQLAELRLLAKHNYEDYIASTGYNEEIMLKDIERAINALEESEYEAFSDYWARSFEQSNIIFKERGEATIKAYKKGWNTCRQWIYSSIALQAEEFYMRWALRENKGDEARAKVEDLVAAKIKSFGYSRPKDRKPKDVEVIATPMQDELTNEGYFTTPRSGLTDTLALVSSRQGVVDKIAHKATIKRNNMILDYNPSAVTFGINTHKTLIAAIEQFAKHNQHGHDSSNVKAADLRVSIPFDEYALLRGYDLTKRPTETHEQEAAEKKRLASTRKDAQRAFKEELEALLSFKVTWEEKIKGKDAAYRGVSLISGYKVSSSGISVTLSLELAEYIKQLPTMTQYPTALFPISANNTNAYTLGLKIAEYANMDSNIRNHREDRLSVKALLRATNLPAYEDLIAKKERHWERKIKEPLENALDTLVYAGLLEDWEYTHAKGVALDNYEAYHITDYQTFSSLYVKFKLANPIDHTKRLEARGKAIEKRKEAAARRAASKAKKEAESSAE